MKRPAFGKFSLVSLRDLLVAAMPTILLVLAGCVAAYIVVDPAPPRSVVLATGQENSAYEEFGRKYAAVLARDGIHVGLQRSLGSADNLQRRSTARPTSLSCRAVRGTARYPGAAI